jgi:hypothetical protein
MERDTLPPGYTPARGRKPSASIWGERVMVCLRNGMMSGPWRIDTTRWDWRDDPFDVVAIKRLD